MSRILLIFLMTILGGCTDTNQGEKILVQDGTPCYYMHGPDRCRVVGHGYSHLDAGSALLVVYCAYPGSNGLRPLFQELHGGSYQIVRQAEFLSRYRCKTLERKKK